MIVGDVAVVSTAGVVGVVVVVNPAMPAHIAACLPGSSHHVHHLVDIMFSSWNRNNLVKTILGSALGCSCELKVFEIFYFLVCPIFSVPFNYYAARTINQSRQSTRC